MRMGGVLHHLMDCSASVNVFSRFYRESLTSLINRKRTEAIGEKSKKKETLKIVIEMHSRYADIFNCYSSIRCCADEGGGVES
jgi:hypothetical protein